MHPAEHLDCDALRAWQGKHGDAWMPFWQISRKHPWTAKEHDDVRTFVTQRDRRAEPTEPRADHSHPRLHGHASTVTRLVR